MGSNISGPSTILIPVQERFPRQQGAERGDGLCGFLQRGPAPRVAGGGDAAQRVDLRPAPVGHDGRQGTLIYDVRKITQPLPYLVLFLGLPFLVLPNQWTN